MIAENPPSETVIYQSKRYNILRIIGSLLPLGFGFSIFLGGGSLDIKPLLSGIFFMLIGFGIIYFSYKDLKNKTPKLLLNFKGIQLNGKDFYAWLTILDVVIYTKPGRNRVNCLRLQTDKGFIECPIDGLTINNVDLQLLIRAYRRKAQSK
ncbi:hypothetical protein EZJ43_04210 [Pedobacter changchengzhani]|uniref:Uncharacterized protein n=1 Tax=Pedobacter changchengzhani TaxID=2529274 RepID=A0A4R5MQ50_9SPHI|nr:hypothetical protein [Pedobacter changchengzhani]TDG37329.1 hypothetical protein EZJ43_04210 [Pedobacter changchengzhani]